MNERYKGITITSEIQVGNIIQLAHESHVHFIQGTVLDDAAKHHPDSWWWLQADGCDINPGLKESVKCQWSGNVDLNDGLLQKQHDAYISRIEQANTIGLEGGSVADQLTLLSSDLKDLKFINSGNCFIRYIIIIMS